MLVENFWTILLLSQENASAGNWQATVTSVIGVATAILTFILSPKLVHLWKLLTSRRRNTERLRRQCQRLRELNIVLLMEIRKHDPEYVPASVSDQLDQLTKTKLPNIEQLEAKHDNEYRR